MKRNDEKGRFGRGRRRNRRAGGRGVITVFVVLIMVPVVTITSLMVDVSRLKLYSAQALAAADAYGDSVLSEFDNLLKDLYGLFAVTQNEEGLAAIETLAKYAGCAFNPNGGDDAAGGGLNLTGFMPYRYADVQFDYKKVDGASLSNNNVLMTQISDFMKYRIIEEVLDEAGILSSLVKIDSTSEYMDVMKSRNEITDSSAKALGKIDEYYQELKKLAAYPFYLQRRQEAFEAYSKELKEIADSDEYREYVNYKLNKSEIDAAKEAVERYENEPSDGASESPAEEGEVPATTIDADTWELSEQWVNEEEYCRSLEDRLRDVQERAKDNSGDPINFDNAEETIKTLGRREGELREVLETLQRQVDELKQKLEECSDEDEDMAEVKEQIRKEIEELEKITDMTEDFRRTYELIEPEHGDINWNYNNKKLMEKHTSELDAVKANLLSGNVQTGDSYWVKTVPLTWYDFLDDKSDFYRQLKELCEGDGDGDEEGDKKAGDKKKEKAQNAQKEAEKEIEEEELPEARDITPELAAQLASHGNSTGTLPDFSDYFSGGLSFDSMQSAGSRLIDKFLVTSYDAGMFSSRVSGIRPENEKSGAEETENGAGGSGEGGSSEAYRDYSLTKVEMSGKVNYLYGAELEYLISGHNKSETNLKDVRNMICGVRTTMNFFSTYRIVQINSAINDIANAAATAVAATVIGAAAAPLVRVAVSGALRLGAAAIMTTEDWKSLKARKDIVFFKEELADIEVPGILEDLLEGALVKDEVSNPGRKKILLGYEDYLYILMCLLVDDNTLLNRTSNLITLNVNQAVNHEDELSSLSFKMADTVTAVEATCKVKMDFAVVPENFLELYLKNTSTETMIRSLEDHYFGYSVIRGY